MSKPKKQSVELYAVRDKNGLWLSSAGFRYHKDNVELVWRPELKEAETWRTLSMARARVTFFADNFPERGIPEVVVLKLTEARPLADKKRAVKVLKRREAERARELVARKEHAIERAKRAVASAQAQLAELL